MALQVGYLVAYLAILADIASSTASALRPSRLLPAPRASPHPFQRAAAITASPIPAGTLIPPGAEPSRVQYMTLLVVGVLLPISCLLKDEERLAQISAFSCALVAAFCAVVLLYAVVPEPDAAGRPLELWNPGGASISLPVMIFAFTGHSLFFPVVRRQRRNRDDVCTQSGTRPRRLSHARTNKQTTQPPRR